MFYVKDSIVSKDTRCHAHTCPVCATVVWSSQSSGRIACRHDTPWGQRCRTNQWYVPDQDAKGAKEGFGGFGAFEATGTLERQYKAMALGSVPLPPGLGVPVLPKPGLNANKIKGPDNPTCQLLPTSSKRKVKIA